MPELANTSLEVMRANYPEHPALDANGEFNYQYNSVVENDSWVSKATFGLFDKEEPPGFDSRRVYNPEFRNDNETLSEAAEQAGKRSWLSWLTFGIID